MTEDDAFIRTLHDKQDDEVPRLVYADWLDEQGDPRGAYLRAEVEYFRDAEGADDSQLKALQEGLDPIWINMVSRAPYGIIVPGLTFSETGPRLTRDDLKRIEEHWQAPLPADYAAFMLLFNGATFNKTCLCITFNNREIHEAVKDDSVSIFSTHAIFWNQGQTNYWLADVITIYNGWMGINTDLDIADRTLPIGTLTNNNRMLTTLGIVLPFENIHGRLVVFNWDSVHGAQILWDGIDCGILTLTQFLCRLSCR